MPKNLCDFSNSVAVWRKIECEKYFFISFHFSFETSRVMQTE